MIEEFFITLFDVTLGVLPVVILTFGAAYLAGKLAGDKGRSLVTRKEESDALGSRDDS